MSRRFKPKEKYVRISMKAIWRNLDGPPKNHELLSYVMSFEFKLFAKCTGFKVSLTNIVICLEKSYSSRISNHWATCFFHECRYMLSSYRPLLNLHNYIRVFKQKSFYVFHFY